MNLIRRCAFPLMAFFFALVLWLLPYFSGSVIVDGFQSLGAVSDSSKPLDLHWPLVGSFMGYQQCWGFHWPGWSLLRSFALPLIPQTPWIDLLLLALIWCTCSWYVIKISSPRSSSLVRVTTYIIALLAPGYLVAAQSYRPEIVTALFLLMILHYWQAKETKPKWMRTAALTILPLLHPLGFVIPVTWFAWDFLRDSKNIGIAKASKNIARNAWPLGLGILLFCSWFAFQPNAWAQFQLNVKSQRQLVDGLGAGWNTFFVWAIGSRDTLPLVGIIFGAILGSLLLIKPVLKGEKSSSEFHQSIYSALGVWIAIIFNIVTKNPNSLHLVAILPMCIILHVRLIDHVGKAIHPILFPIGMVTTLLVLSIYPLKNTYILYQNNGRSYRREIVASLDTLPRADKVLIPVAFWEAALEKQRDTGQVYQFSTFPNILNKADRTIYEQQILSNVKAGDLLLWDPLQELGGVFNFVEITALRHQVIRPPSQPDLWEEIKRIHIPTHYSKGQPVEFLVYRKK